MQRILAIVVLYFPEKPVAQLDVDDTIIVDNTHNNIGVAAALNKGLKKAIDEGYDWLLTMDQDSVFEAGALDELKSVAFSCKENIAIVSPFHYIKKPVRTQSIEEVPFTMTSGNLLRVSAAKAVGPFEEKLFIDSVDNEYCLRLRKHGFKVIRVNRSILHHSLGTLKNNIVTHDATRRYYITRNMLYVMKKYFPKFFLFGSKELTKSFLLILFIESEKIPKLQAMARGASDFFRNKYN